MAILFQVSSTTLAILVSLGLALPEIFSQESAIKGMTSTFWYTGIWINMGVVLYALALHLKPVEEEPPEWPTRLAFSALILAYVSVFFATVGINQIL